MEQPAVTIQQFAVTVPQPTIPVSQQPQSSMWRPQNQNLSNVPFQSYVGPIQPPLVDVNQPLVGGQYTLWSQPPITGGKIPNVTPPMITQNVNMGQPIWKKPLPQAQQHLWGHTTTSPSTSNVGPNAQGMVHDPWGHIPPNPLNQHAYQHAYQQVPQIPPQQPPLPPYMGGPLPIYGPTRTPMPHQY